MNSDRDARISGNLASDNVNQFSNLLYRSFPQPKSGKSATGFTGRRFGMSYPNTPRQGSWVTYNSPLWKKDLVQTEAQLNASFLTRSKCFSIYEAGFLNDAIRTSICSTRRIPVIPTYNALLDKYSQAYFKSPLVQSVLERNVSASMKKNKRTINKLSVRRRCISTPDNFKLWQLENGFINDAIITEKMRTKYKDIIPPYDARRDQCCQMYFQRDDVKRLLTRTCAPRIKFHVKSNSAVS